MSDLSARLALPYLAPGQAQKHVTHNEALERLDLLVQLVVQDFAAASPPPAPQEGQIWALGAAPGGAWAGQAGALAAWTGGAWLFLTPGEGWRAWGVAEDEIRVYTGGNWIAPALPDVFQDLDLLGVRRNADAANPLSVAGEGSLFTHEGAGHQIRVNKAGSAQTASLLFQSGFSGRAEVGLIGDNDLTLKVSADGTSFAEALVAHRASGLVSLPQGLRTDGFSLRDPADPTRAGAFSAAGIDPNTIRSYTLPNQSGTLALLDGNQVFSGPVTLAGTVSVSGSLSLDAAGAEIGTATGNSAYGLGAGATAAGATKTVNIATGGQAGSTSVVNIGAAAGGQVVVHAPAVSFAASVATIGAPASTVTAAGLGLGGASPDSTNRLSVNAPASLLNHDGAGHEATVNKAAPAHDAALAFKTGFSARALMGLLGSDDLTLKVSADGALFVTALTVDRSNGRVGLPQGAALGALTADPPAPPEGALWYNSTAGQLRARAGGATRGLTGRDVPFLVPPAGEHVMSVIGGGATLGTVAGGAGRIDLFPFAPRAELSVDALSVNVTGAAAGQARLVVYGSDPQGRPAGLILETADLDCSTTGLKTIAATLALTGGLTYWLGVRLSAGPTLSAWANAQTPDINGGTPTTQARKILRRSLAFATPAPANWGFLSSEITSGVSATAIWLRMG